VNPATADILRERSGHDKPTVGDLVELAKERQRQGKPLKLGGDNQFSNRPEWLWLRQRYHFPGDLFAFHAMDPTLLCGSVREGSQIDAAVAYSTDGRIPLLGLQTLVDTEGALPHYDALLLLSPEAAGNAEIVARLTPLLGTISDDAMRQANLRVDEQKWSPAKAAKELAGQLLPPNRFKPGTPPGSGGPSSP